MEGLVDHDDHYGGRVENRGGNGECTGTHWRMLMLSREEQAACPAECSSRQCRLISLCLDAGGAFLAEKLHNDVAPLAVPPSQQEGSRQVRCFRALCCKGPPPARPEYDLVCIGLTGSGKTSLLSKLCSESPNSVVSTTGFSIKAVPFQNAILNVKELGGADNIRKYWSRYYQGSQGVIFVLDSASSEDDLETARNELHSALQHPQLCTLPFLILANHQDKPAARSVQE
ncbi:PREDICTED: ADP-ribosylation factor-like protein 15-like, partial [Lipotes vexillifer]|uniref:ADP-ribosylation factor-like protein 15 n=1 Tax=Lipotes vexillifer TaxID=118797 RepID=A0A340WQ94_LIPVE